jgi:molybdopterin-guanine dinucleotide biosynthesis protein A
MVDGYAAVILAGGEASRLGGGGLKATRPVRGTPLLSRVLAAVDGAQRAVVVGPPELASLVPQDTLLTREEPPGGGPVAALAAGLAALGRAPAPSRHRTSGGDASDGDAGGVPGTGIAEPYIGVFATDLALLTPSAVSTLRTALTSPTANRSGRADRPHPADVALFVDDDGRAQYLCAVWRTAALLRTVAALGDPAGRPMRAVTGQVRTAEVRYGRADGAPAWYDCDTEEELRRAEEWLA